MNKTVYPAQHADETATDFLARVVGAFSFEDGAVLDDLPSIEAALAFFGLWHRYDTDLLAGVEEAIEGGEDPTPYNAFVRRWGLPWALYGDGKWTEPSSYRLKWQVKVSDTGAYVGFYGPDGAWNSFNSYPLAEEESAQAHAKMMNDGEQRRREVEENRQ